MLDQPGELAMAPNGNGGVYVSLRDSGLLASLEADGVKSLFQFGVDNVLCHVADPTFLGFCASRDADCAAKTVPKREPHEPVGAIALSDGAPAVVEYSEISSEMAEATDKSGRLLFGSAHICVNYFSIAFLRTFCEQKLATLPLHVAHKKIPYVQPNGDRVTPSTNNGVKLEYFIFDTFPHAKAMAVLEVPREEEFAPVKNPPGAKSDSPDTARQLIYSINRARLEAAGGSIRQPLQQVAAAGSDSDRSGKEPSALHKLTSLGGLLYTPPVEGGGKAEEIVVEISPLLSFQGEGLAEYVAGKTLEAPIELKGDENPVTPSLS